MKMRVACVAALLVATVQTPLADPVPELDYQGKVLVNDLPFHGSGYFKFALANSASNNLWSNDGSGWGEPAGCLTNPVANGIFSVRLGAAPMAAISPVIFASGTGHHLRVWFGSTNTAFSEMLPAQRLVSAAFALNSHMVDGYHATNLIAAATNGVTLAGDVTGPPQANQIAANAVTTAEIAGDTIQAADIAPGGVASSELLDGSVASADIMDGTIASVDILDGTITTADVALDTLTAADLAADSVGASEIAAGAVGTSELADGTVASIDIADSTIADIDVSPTAGIVGTKIQQGTTALRGTLQLAPGSTGATAIASGHPYLNAYGAVNTLIAAAPNSPLAIVGAGGIYVSNVAPATVVIGVGALPAPALANLDNVIWVATNGTLAGPGTIDKPYDTPQNGYNAAAARYPGQPAAVLLAAGTHAGGLTMSAGNVHVIGMARAVLDSLTVSAFAPAFLMGKQRVENVVVKGATFVAAAGTGVKFYNTRMLGSLQINGNQVEVQNCHITQNDLAGGAYAVLVGSGGDLTTDIGFYHSAIEYAAAGGPAVQVNQLVRNFEMLWNEISCTGGGPAVLDNENAGPLNPVHLYAHNWIKGPGPESIVATVQDPLAGQNGRTIGFYNNTVWGHVGTGGRPQYYGNNMVYGRINFLGAAPIGWTQAGAGAGADAANNTEHQGAFPTLPNTYRD